jgi:hypothetical protein
MERILNTLIFKRYKTCTDVRTPSINIDISTIKRPYRERGQGADNTDTQKR